MTEPRSLLDLQAAAPHVTILGVDVSGVNMEQALARTEHLIAAEGKGYICVTGVHGIMEAQRDTVLRQILNRAFLCVPDGMPTVWIGRLYGHTKMRRVYGPDFMLALCDQSREKGYRHFFYGGNDGIADELARTLSGRFPGLQVAGAYTPPFRPLTASEADALRLQISEVKPDIFWVGLSTPKQERFMHEALDKLDVKVMVGVGAAFDIHTGRIQDAPGWMKQAGLQWLHRLLQEPRRLARRYLINNPIFLARIGLQLASDSLAGRLRVRQ